MPHDPKYGDANPLERLAEGEPYFFLRAQDLMAPAAVESYANLLSIVGVALNNADMQRHALAVKEIANRMRLWQAANAARAKWPD